MSSEASDTRLSATGDDVAMFHRTLAELCRAEVPLGRAFQIIEAEVESKAVRKAARDMGHDVEAGHELSSAYARHAQAFPGFYPRLIEAGVQAGDLPGALEQIAHHAAHRADVTTRLRRALSYPLTTAVFVILVASCVLAFASPRLWAFTERVSGTSPWPIALFAVVGLALVVMAVLWFARRRRRAGTSGGFGLPIVGPLRFAAARASLASTLALLVRRQVPLHEALRQASASSENPEIRDRVAAMAAEAESGEGLVQAMRAGDLFEPSLMWLVQTGEQSGATANALEDIASIYRRRLARGLDRCAVLVRPAMELVVGVAVLFIAYSFMVPLFKYANGLFRL